MGAGDRGDEGVEGSGAHRAARCPKRGRGLPVTSGCVRAEWQGREVGFRLLQDYLSGDASLEGDGDEGTDR